MKKFVLWWLRNSNDIISIISLHKTECSSHLFTTIISTILCREAGRAVSLTPIPLLFSLIGHNYSTLQDDYALTSMTSRYFRLHYGLIDYKEHTICLILYYKIKSNAVPFSTASNSVALIPPWYRVLCKAVHTTRSYWLWKKNLFSSSPIFSLLLPT